MRLGSAIIQGLAWHQHTAYVPCIVGNFYDHVRRGKKGRQLFEDGRWVSMQQEDHLRLSKHAAQVSFRKLYPSIRHEVVLLALH